MIFLSSLLFSYENIYTLKGGLLLHSTGPISSGREDGIDINTEIVFKNIYLNAHPSVGAEINLNGDTSFIYSGLVWEWKIYKDFLFNLFFGFAVNNGELNNGMEGKRQMGTHVTFREDIEFGYRLNKKWVVSLMYAHYSNLGIDNKRNQGNDNTGIRFSYYF